MSLVDHFRDMARNNAWANDRLLGACRQLTDEEFAAPRVGFFPSLRQTLNHILIVDRYYLADMQSAGRVLLTDEEPYATAAPLAAEQRRVDRALVAFCDPLTEADLDRVVAIDRKDGVDYRDRIADILAHLFQHQIHHRGQAHCMLAGTNVPPPQLDEFFLAGDVARRNEELRRIGI